MVVIPPANTKKKANDARNSTKNKANLSQNSDKLTKTPSKLTRDQKKKSTAADFDAPDPIEPSADNDYVDPSNGS